MDLTKHLFGVMVKKKFTERSEVNMTNKMNNHIGNKGFAPEYMQ